MIKTFPKIINPWLLLQNASSVEGVLDIADMAYLKSSQQKESGEVLVYVDVKRKEDKKVYLSGSAKTELHMICQRCLSEIKEKIDTDFSFVLVKYDAQLESLDEDGPDGLACEESLSIVPLVEQELILALPMIPKHADCQFTRQNDVVEVDDRQQPFVNLKDLLK